MLLSLVFNDNDDGDDANINSAWKTIRENIKIVFKVIHIYYEVMKHKP
jgi:hypothetical protein